MDELKALVKLVSDSVERIEKSCQARNVSFPSLNEVYSLQSEAARLDPNVLKAAADISAATAQLSALVRPPPLTLITTSRQVCKASMSFFATTSRPFTSIVVSISYRPRLDLSTKSTLQRS